MDRGPGQLRSLLAPREASYPGRNSATCSPRQPTGGSSMTCPRPRAPMLRALVVSLLLAGLAGARARASYGQEAGAASASKAGAGRGIHFVYLVRHGAFDHDDSTTDNRAGRGLNALGHEQARLVGERLAELPVDFDRLICSEYLRAVETADVVGGILDMTPIRDSLLNECTPTTL